MPNESCFKLATTSLPQPADGQLLVRTRFISVDPYMRGRMIDHKIVRSAVSTQRGSERRSRRGCRRIKVEQASGKGDVVVGNLGWQDYSVAGEKEVRKINPDIAPVSTALGVLGMTGLTAYFGLLDIGQPKP